VILVLGVWTSSAPTAVSTGASGSIVIGVAVITSRTFIAALLGLASPRTGCKATVTAKDREVTVFDGGPTRQGETLLAAERVWHRTTGSDSRSLP